MSFSGTTNVKYPRFPSGIDVDARGRLWIYDALLKGFVVREYIGDDYWDISRHKSEGKPFEFKGR